MEVVQKHTEEQSQGNGQWEFWKWASTLHKLPVVQGKAIEDVQKKCSFFLKSSWFSDFDSAESVLKTYVNDGSLRQLASQASMSRRMFQNTCFWCDHLDRDLSSRTAWISVMTGYGWNGTVVVSRCVDSAVAVVIGYKEFIDESSASWDVRVKVLFSPWTAQDIVSQYPGITLFEREVKPSSPDVRSWSAVGRTVDLRILLSQFWRKQIGEWDPKPVVAHWCFCTRSLHDVRQCVVHTSHLFDYTLSSVFGIGD